MDNIPMEQYHRHNHPVRWVLVADSKHMQVYINTRIKNNIPIGGKTHQHYKEQYAQELIPVEGMRWEAEPPENYDFSNETLGRVFESASTTRHMSEPRIDIHEKILLDLVRAVSDTLGTAYTNKDFD